MTFKSSVGKLFYLFDMCSDTSDEYIEKNLLLEQILSDKKYIQITGKISDNNYFEEIFSRDRLIKMSNAQLSEIYDCIQIIPECIDKIKNSINYGNGYEIIKGDFPDFTSKKSIEKLCQKLNWNNPSFNVTNIASDDYFRIFEDDTVKNLDEFINTLNLSDFDNINEIIEKKLEGKKYCINGNSLEERKDKLMEEQDDTAISELRAGLKKRSKKRLKITLIIAGIVIAIAIIVAIILLTL